ncbi:SpoIIE family protein phosphatase [Aeoliella mucimassa]|uniref:Phosphoserine phosphatase RsbU n=1 Tax=Aeoliella mucimassa TaxID=2527972 RepID=A0A518ALL2_9BACT|nr:SpoIIE family protein phosphatase [Aeoliella mucimassa]QDU55620.1 Phosphoserine phosphatase RsbU [Aeoliella mucimassa]
MAFLEILQGVEPGKRIEIPPGRSVMGRSSECDIPLDVAAVSRQHAAIIKESDGVFVEDLNSRNGTFVNEQRVEGRRQLKHGDRILICDQVLGVHVMQGVPLGGHEPKDDTSLAYLMDDHGTASVMATLDVSARAASIGLSARPEVKLAALLEISNSLSKTLQVEQILPKILDSLFKIFLQADRGFVIMRPGDDAPLVPVADKYRKAGQDERTRISKTIVQQAMDNKSAILSADAATDERFGLAESISDFQIRSMMCAPMLDSEGHPLGVIQIDTNNQKSKFSNEDLEVLAAVASQAAVAIDNARMHEVAVEQRALQRDLDLAARMQRALLPSKAPEVSGYRFFDYYESARQVGGDYYDYVTLADGRFAVVLGDVAGKGVSAAILMARLSSDVRFSLASEKCPAAAVSRANFTFAQHDWADRFVTMIVAVVDPAAHRMTLVNAGHMPPLLRRASGEVVEVGDEIAGLPIGVIDDFEYESLDLELAPGDSLTMFTDGFSEAMNSARDLYGLERLAEQIKVGDADVEKLGHHVLSDVRSFVGDFAQSDDMCLACFGRCG